VRLTNPHSAHKFSKLLKYWPYFTMWKNKCATYAAPLTLPATGDLLRKHISVGIKDMRVGNHRIRSAISQNRQNIYGCFISLIRECASPAFAVLFFYFSDLHHPACKHDRGKHIVLA
jgi:hypothetical protein